jgi:predicted RNA polymerase sigma factor
MNELDALAGVLNRYHLYHATHAELLRELGRPDQARVADRLALELTANPPSKPSSNSASPGPIDDCPPMLR